MSRHLIIPETSTVTPQGFWFIFDDSEAKVAACFSFFGKERIFLNGTLVTDKTSFRVHSTYAFSEGNCNYVMQVHAPLYLLNGKITCDLRVDDQPVQTIQCVYTANYIQILLMSLGLGGSLAFIGIISMLLHLPSFIKFILFFAFYVGLFKWTPLAKWIPLSVVFRNVDPKLMNGITP